MSLVHVVRGRKPAIVASAVAENSPAGDWRSASDSLARMLLEPEWRESRIECVLSHRWCRLSLIPGGIRLRNRGEEEQFARMRLSRDNGELPGHWEIALAGSDFDGGPRVACAIDGEFLRSIDAAAARAKCRVASVQPLLAASYNGRRLSIGNRHAWFVTVESDRCCIARIDRGVWRSVRLRRLFGNPEAEVAALLSQERLLADSAELPSEVFVCAPDFPGFALPPIGPWTLSAAPNLWSHTDPTIALALEGQT